MENEEQKAKIEVENSKCKNCGSDLVFDPKCQKLKCARCQSEFPITSEVVTYRADYIPNEPDIDTHEWAKAKKEVHCKTCGATFEMKGYEFTRQCPYCESTYVMEKRELYGLKPDAVIPFMISKDQALEKFKEGIKGKFFVPSQFKKNLAKNNIQCLYAPSFTFDNDTSSQYEGVLERDETVRRGKETRVVTRRFRVSGVQNQKNRNYIIESGEDLNDKQVTKIYPFDLTHLMAYSDDYLRGFEAKHYEDDVDVCHERAIKKIDANIRSNILSKYTYDRVAWLNVSTEYMNEKYLYVLLPIYHFVFHYKDKDYTVVMNGQTGKVGKGLPKSALKITLLVLVIVALLTLLVVLFMCRN